MPRQRTEWDIGDPAVSVVGNRFCNPYPMELIVKRKIMNFSRDHYEVFDSSGNILLQIDGAAWGFSRKRVMRDPAGFAVLTMREKPFTLKRKWEVYRGEGKEQEDLLFGLQQSHPMTLKTSVEVYLPHNFKKDVCDFRASGGYSNLSFKVLKDEAILAAVTHKFTWGSFCKGKYSFRIRVNPEVDFAFVVALLVVVDDNETLC